MRECGECSLCCKLIEVEPLNKPVNVWCSHCDPGRGCKIHADRPDACRNYFCNWVVDYLPDEWYPRKAHIIVDFVDVPPDGVFMRFTVDPLYPNRWRENPYYPYIKSMALRGLKSGKYRTAVSINGVWTLVLPDKEVPHQAGTLLEYASGKYEFIPYVGEEVLRDRRA